MMSGPDYIFFGVLLLWAGVAILSATTPVERMIDRYIDWRIEKESPGFFERQERRSRLIREMEGRVTARMRQEAERLREEGQSSGISRT